MRELLGFSKSKMVVKILDWLVSWFVGCFNGE